ncbi:START domain-containing protein [Aquabacterium sp.]|uniref:START domain-containing protein n=1 Tax=Aquabacterium sp. TaxID=1872578 RepID=UPI003D6D7C2C
MWNPRPLSATLLAVLLTFALLPSQALAQEDWKLHKDTEGIQLYTREVPGQVLKNFRGVMQIDAPLRQVAAMLADVPAMPEWFFMLKESRFIKGEHVDDSYVYLAMKGIWPVSPRDVIVHVKVRQDPVTLTIHADVESEEGILPRQEGFVRLPSMRAKWRLTPVNPQHTEVEISGSADPGGMIPLAIANFAVTVLPEQTLKKMRVHLARPEYKDLKIIYAKNPKLRELAERMTFP